MHKKSWFKPGLKLPLLMSHWTRHKHCNQTGKVTSNLVAFWKALFSQNFCFKIALRPIYEGNTSPRLIFLMIIHLTYDMYFYYSSLMHRFFVADIITNYLQTNSYRKMKAI